MKETLEIKDLDFLANLMLVFFHAGEICIRATEDYFKDRYRASQEYQQLRKKYGKTNQLCLIPIIKPSTKMWLVR